MCMEFGCNLQILLVTFLQFELCHFCVRFLPKHIDTGYLGNATPPTILAGYFFKILQVFLSMSENVHNV